MTGWTTRSRWRPLCAVVPFPCGEYRAYFHEYYSTASCTTTGIYIVYNTRTPSRSPKKTNLLLRHCHPPLHPQFVLFVALPAATQQSNGILVSLIIVPLFFCYSLLISLFDISKEKPPRPYPTVRATDFFWRYFYISWSSQRLYYPACVCVFFFVEILNETRKSFAWNGFTLFFNSFLYARKTTGKTERIIYNIFFLKRGAGEKKTTKNNLPRVLKTTPNECVHVAYTIYRMRSDQSFVLKFL